ncbi:MAG: class I SAM-dependent methyltransferase [Acidobacteriota bacterium]
MADQSVASFWDLAYTSGEYLEHWESPHPPLELAAALAGGLIPAASKVLDLGCGAGAEAVFLAQHGCEAIGVDASAAAIDLARQQATRAGASVQLHCADVTRLPLADRSIDFATDRGCFHAIDDDLRPAYVRELARVLVPGGGFLLRGARTDCEEEGVFAIDAAALQRDFVGRGFTHGPLVEIDLVAESGSLPAHLVLLHRL